MKLVAILCAIVALSWAVPISAGVWKSPDGKIKFQIPDDGSLVSMPNPPAPAVAAWVSADHQSHLIVISSPVPQNVHLVRSDLEQGSLKAFPGGTLLSSTETAMSGVPIFNIEGSNKSGSLFFRQTIVAINGVAYKLMAAGPVRISSDPTLSPVFQSFSIVKPAAVAAPAVPADNPIETPQQHDTSVNIAKLGFAAFFIAILVVVIRRGNKRPRQPPPLP